MKPNSLNKNYRYVFSDLNGKEDLKDARIKFDISFVPENYADLAKQNATVRAFVVVIDSKHIEEIEAIMEQNRGRLKNEEITMSQILRPVKHMFVWYDEIEFQIQKNDQNWKNHHFNKSAKIEKEAVTYTEFFYEIINYTKSESATKPGYNTPTGYNRRNLQKG